jgi:hypothetical protein
MLNTYVSSFGDIETEENFSFKWAQKVRSTLKENKIEYREVRPHEGSILVIVLVAEKDIKRTCKLLKIKQEFVDIDFANYETKGKFFE